MLILTQMWKRCRCRKQLSRPQPHPFARHETYDDLALTQSPSQAEVSEAKVALEALTAEHGECAGTLKVRDAKITEIEGQRQGLEDSLAAENIALESLTAKHDAVSAELAEVKAALEARTAEHEQCVGTLEVRDAKIMEIEEQR